MDTKKTMDKKKEQQKNNKQEKSTNKCKYNEPCSQNKLCGDCGADRYENEQYEESVENFKIDRKMVLNSTF
jgi:hypothetical protein